MKVKKCAFTGHRPQSLPFGFNESDERCIALKQTLRAEIIRLIEQEGVTHFISGMALGVDMYAAEIVLGLKSSYEGITLESAIPCESQAEKWTEKQRDRYFEIASKCDKETLIQHHYTSDCMHKLHGRSGRLYHCCMGRQTQRDGQDSPVCPTTRQAGYNYQSENNAC